MIKRTRGTSDWRILTAKMSESGDLVFEGHDMGPRVAEFWGEDEYEYWLTVSEDHKKSVLVSLVKDHFVRVIDFSAWLESEGIAYEAINISARKGARVVAKITEEGTWQWWILPLKKTRTDWQCPSLTLTLSS